MNWAWASLFTAGLLEIAWAIGLKLSNGFTRPLPAALTVAAMILSFFLLSLALKSIPIGTAYSIWTGIGAVGTVIAGMILFGEPRDAIRIACIALIVCGILGLKVLSPDS